MNNNSKNTHTNTVLSTKKSKVSVKMNNNKERLNNQTYQNNLDKLNEPSTNYLSKEKTSAEIAAEQWDSWLGNPDDHEITRNLNQYDKNL